MSDLELIAIGLNHQTAPVELREKLSASASALPGILARLGTEAGLREAVVLSTCNRFEIYGVTAGGSASVDSLLNIAGQRNNSLRHDPRGFAPYIYVHRGGAAIRHLFRVASSLDSLVVGETEIVGQVKTAYQAAQTAGSTGKVLNQLFQKALSVSKQVRHRSGIGRCATSVGSVSVELAAKIFGDNLQDRTVLIIGAGKISETTLRHLSKRGAQSILVSNRSYHRAQELARLYNGQAYPLDQISNLLVAADIVISSTSAPGFILDKTHFDSIRPRRRSRPLFLIDLAVPRDIDPAAQDLQGVYLYNVDQLGDLARQNRKLRQSEAAASELLIATQSEAFAKRLFSLPHPQPPPTGTAWPSLHLPNWAEAV